MEQFCSASLTTSLNGISSHTEHKEDLKQFKTNIARTLNSRSLLQFNEDYSSKKQNEEPKKKSKFWDFSFTGSTKSQPAARIPVKCVTDVASYQSYDAFKKKDQKQQNQRELMKIDQISKLHQIPVRTDSKNEIDRLIYAALSNNLKKKQEERSDLTKSKFSSPFMFRRSSATSTNSSTAIEECLRTSSEITFKVRTSSAINLSSSSQIIDDKISRISPAVSHLTLSDSGLSSSNSTQLFLAELRGCIRLSSSAETSDTNIYEPVSELLETGTSSPGHRSFASILECKSKIRNLIKKSPDKCASSSKPKKMQTPFDNANLETLEFLLQLKKEENVPINQIADQDGNSLMHKAIIYNQYEVVRYLLANYPSLINLKNCYGIYPIHLCVLSGNMQLLRLISRESKKLINKRDHNGFTPAMHAAIEGKYESLKYLLDNANAKFSKLTKNTRLDKYTLLHLGVVSGSLDVVQYLLLKMGMSYLKYRTKDGATVFHLAAARGHDQILAYLLAIKSSKHVRHWKDITGSTPAHDAAENGNCKCLKLLHDASLDMFSEDIEHITPYDLAMASKIPECRTFANSLKPTVSLDDGPIQINNSSLLTIDLNSTSLIIPSNGGSKKVNLRRISSMLRLRRAKDLNHEPAYLYTQRFRPAPVSLPQSSNITGSIHQNGSIHENEDDLNDSALDELINQVHNNVNKKHNKQLQSNSRSNSPNRITGKSGTATEASNGVSLKANGTGITADIIRRVSRYQKHCQQLEKSDYIEPKKHSDSPETNGNVLKKSSFSSSQDNTPSVRVNNKSVSEAKENGKLDESIDSKEQSMDGKGSSFTTPQKSPIEIYKETIANKVTLIDSGNNKTNFVIPPPPPMPPPLQQQNSGSSINSSLSTRLPNSNSPKQTTTNEEAPSDYCTINELRQQADTTNEDEDNNNTTSEMSPNSLKNLGKGKSVAFREGPPCLIENNQFMKEDEILMRKSSLGRYSSRSELSLSSKGRRKSLTNYLTDKAQLVSKASKLFNSKSTNQLKEPDSDSQSSEKPKVLKYSSQCLTRNGEFYEPEPDYDWDSPDHSESISKSSETKKMNISDNSDQEDSKSSMKKAVSLAEIIVQSMSASNSNKSSLSSSSSKLAGHKIDQKKSLDKIIMPMIAQSANSTLDHPQKQQQQADNKTTTTTITTTSPVTVNVKLEKKSSIVWRDSNCHSSSNIYNSLEGEQNSRSPSRTNSKGAYITSFQTNTSSAVFSVEEKSTVVTKAVAPPPPPPPMPAFGFNGVAEHTSSVVSSMTTSSSSSSPLHKQQAPTISLDSETLVQARQKLKIQTSSSSESSDKENDKGNGDQKKKKNEFLLKEIQNHRLYNTKKDYVLDFLDRGSDKKSSKTKTATESTSPDNQTLNKTTNNNRPCVIVINKSSGSTTFNRSLSNINVKDLDNDVSTSSGNNNLHTTGTISPSNSSSSNKSDKAQANYERFPYTKNSTRQTPQHQVYNKYTNPANNNNYINGSNHFNELKTRVQSTGVLPNERNNLLPNYTSRKIPNTNGIGAKSHFVSNGYAKSPYSAKSVSVDRLNSVEDRNSGSSSAKPYSTPKSYELVNESKKILKISIGERNDSDEVEPKQDSATKKLSTSISDLLNNYEQISNKKSNAGSFTKPYQNQKALSSNQIPQTNDKVFVKTFSTIGEPIYEANHLQMKPKRSSNGPFESGFVKSANAFNSTKLLVNGSGSTRSRLSKQRPVQARDSSDGKPRIRLLEPPQKCESELERVFKKRALHNLDN